MLIREVWLRQVKLCLRHSEVLRLCRNVKLSAPQHLRSKLHRAATSRCEASLQAPRGALSSKKTTFVYQTNVVFFVVPLTGLEPVRSCPQRILSPRCLPFHHNGIYSIILTRLPKIVKWGTAHRPFPTFLFQQSIQKFRALFPEFLPGTIII